MDNDYTKQKQDSLTFLSRHGQANVVAGMQAESAKVLAASADQIADAIARLDKTVAKSSETADRLGRKVYWLNVVIAFGALVAFADVVHHWLK